MRPTPSNPDVAAHGALDQAVLARASTATAMFSDLASNTHDGDGITRASYGDGEQYAHACMARYARAIGLEIASDAAGNTYATLPGSERSLAPIIIGSHLDSVAQGGNFDGAAGVVSGLVAAAALRDAGIQLRRDVRVMGIRAEESAWFGVSYIGSRSALGTLPDGALEHARRSDSGLTLSEHMLQCGADPSAISSTAPYLPPASLHAYLEVHIEQGPVLEASAIAVGIVTGIRANRRLPRARCVGEYSHCGGVPRSHRRDAAIAVARLVSQLDDWWDACEERDQDFAFTVGKLGTDPSWHAMTKIAGEVNFSLDMRSLDANLLDATEAQLHSCVAALSTKYGVSFELGETTSAAPGVLAQGIRAGLQESAASLAIPTIEIASGASHDAAAFAAAGVPTAMLFIRNANGSHNPHEAMEITDFIDATRILALWLVNAE